MKHLCITDAGKHIGLHSNRVIIKENGNTVSEYPLSRIKTIVIDKNGISLSSNVITTCAARGIKLFFTDFKGVPVASLSGTHSHAVVEMRKKQFDTVSNKRSIEISKLLISGKLKNQRAVLEYYGKYLRKTENTYYERIKEASERIKRLSKSALDISEDLKRWRQYLLGIEGKGADVYFDALFDAGFMHNAEKRRIGRGATDPVNSALNYGYGILSSYIWNAVINAGLEPYAGFLHTDRPGKPSLVLDIMEEYRPWVVDRVVINERNNLSCDTKFSIKKRKMIINKIQETFSKKYSYNKKRLTLETIVQRQVYKMAGFFSGKRNYKPYTFKW